MAKLHETLAVEGELAGAAKKILDETKATLKNRDAHFTGSVKRYEPFSDAERDSQTTEEHKALVTTVHDKLDYMWGHVTRWFDAVLQKEATNQTAKADVMIDGKAVAKDVPATFLLGLETKLKDIRHIFDEIPTLQPGIEWIKDVTQGDHVYKAKHPVVSFRTKKMLQSKIIVEANDKHPAQAEKWFDDINIGKYTANTWSSMLSPAEKSALIGRLDKLIHAVKEARQRANCAEVVNTRIGQSIVDYIMKG